MSYRPWFERYPRILADEHEEMARRGFSLDEAARDSIQQIHFIGRSAEDPTLELTVKYPDSFPSKPPRVFTSMGSRLLKRHHHPVTREICTFGQGQSRWSAIRFGTDAIDEAEGVIRDMSGISASTSDLIDDAPEPASATYQYVSPTYVLVPPAVARFGSELAVGSTGSFRLRFKNWPGHSEARFGAGRSVITDIQLGKTSTRGEAYFEELVASGISINNGVFVRLAQAPPFFKNAGEFVAWLASIGQERRDWMAFIFPEQIGSINSSRTAWLVIRSTRERKPEFLRTFVMDGSGRKVRVPGLGDLVNKNVVLIGCGSMGSKVGAGLAATGVEMFGLVDCDFLEPDNAVRHEAGVDLFGLSKPEALAQRMIHLNPGVAGKINLLDIVISAINNVSQEAKLQQLLASASLIIETTGDHGISRFLNDICSDLGVPQLYASVTNGAWAGEVVRVIPGRTPCWLCWNAQYYKSPPPGEQPPGPGVFAPGCDQPTFTGTTYDVGVVANLACEMAVDTLLIDDAGRKHFSGDYLRWQLKDANGNLSPRIDVLAFEKRPDCPACGLPVV